LQNCAFLQNRCPSTFGNGGAIRAVNSGLQAAVCSFQRNEGYDGGALHISAGTATSLTHCLMWENQARWNGGAMYLNEIDATITN
jgi:hypothetical protein